jgi:hypothetical protein
VRDVLAKQAVYLVDFNLDGWAIGDLWAVPTQPYARGNSLGTDLNRQMPTVGRINTSRNPLQESEMKYGVKVMHDVAAAGPGGKLAYGADIHGELTSQAYMDIMYPAGQVNSVDHRRLMAIAERTKSVIDSTLFAGIIDELGVGTTLGLAHKALIFGSLVLAWTFGNTVYTLHYAHLYYRRGDEGKDSAGLLFPGPAEPLMSDFAYFAFTLGVAVQTSDVQVTSREIRKVVTAHCVIGFFFNLGALALAINVLGSR